MHIVTEGTLDTIDLMLSTRFLQLVLFTMLAHNGGGCSPTQLESIRLGKAAMEGFPVGSWVCQYLHFETNVVQNATNCVLAEFKGKSLHFI